MLGPFAARCGRRYALPVDQRLKLLGDIHVQLHDALVALSLAAILGAHREANRTSEIQAVTSPVRFESLCEKAEGRRLRHRPSSSSPVRWISAFALIHLGVCAGASNPATPATVDSVDITTRART